MFVCWADPVVHLHLLKSSMVCTLKKTGDLEKFVIRCNVHQVPTHSVPQMTPNISTNALGTYL